jgi:hypothetical protein
MRKITSMSAVIAVRMTAINGIASDVLTRPLGDNVLVDVIVRAVTFRQ